MSLVFEIDFLIAVISWIESIGGGWAEKVGGEAR